ncbi:MAG: 16S rRNA (cytosine(1402)-N(4))-methyltransferase RsmH [Chlamydiales bacterium]|nr:16S rRNA (cytosine(1402)-N(4))-methyltransferase RsmH [Chlamydiales bacterium]
MTPKEKREHFPVLQREVLASFAGMKISVFFEGTVGAGGHAKAILEAHPEIERYIGSDLDPEALEIARKVLEPWKDKVDLVHGNFADLDTYLKEREIETVDGFFFDLGVSTMQLTKGYKGFSFSKEGPLDMRMDPHGDLTAKEVVNTWPEEKLGQLFREYGEEPRWRRAAKAIVDARRQKKIETTTQLSDVIAKALKTPLKGKWHPATLIFQALRICVNRELDTIAEGISKAVHLLSPGGRLGVISFHSLEDRIVKNRKEFFSDFLSA